MSTFDVSDGNSELRVPPPPRPIEYRDLDDRGWWISMLLGLVLVGIGIWMLTNLYDSVVVLAWLAGASLVIGGAIEVVALGGRDYAGGAAWVAGGIMVVAGLILLAWPDATLLVLAIVTGCCLLGAGLIRVAMALMNRHEPNFGWGLGLGGVGIALGAVILAWPEATLLVLAVLFGIRAIGTGLVAIGSSWQLHRMAG